MLVVTRPVGEVILVLALIRIVSVSCWLIEGIEVEDDFMEAVVALLLFLNTQRIRDRQYVNLIRAVRIQVRSKPRSRPDPERADVGRHGPALFRS